jgi:hypothetical protein
LVFSLVASRRRPLDGGVAVKLRPVVDRDGPDRAQLGLDEPRRALTDLSRRALAQLPEHDIAGLPLDQA